MKTCYHAVVMLSKAATTHCSSELWMICFAPVQALLADLELLRQKHPYPDHPKEGMPGCRNVVFWATKGKHLGRR